MSGQSREELLAQGWMRRFTIEAQRASEFVQLYGNLGFETLTLPANREDLEGLCGQDCFAGAQKLYCTIFTRPNKSAKEDRDLW